jgi:hypothetical protein
MFLPHEFVLLLTQSQNIENCHLLVTSAGRQCTAQQQPHLQ